MIATPSPFMEGAKPAARTLALAAALSIAGHGALLAAGYWLWDAMAPPRVPPMVRISVVSKPALTPAPRAVNARPAAKPVTNRTRPENTVRKKIRRPHQPRPQPVKTTVARSKPRMALPAIPIPDWVKTPPVPPKRPAFRTKKLSASRGAPISIRIQKTVVARPPTAAPPPTAPLAPRAPTSAPAARALNETFPIHEQGAGLSPAGPAGAASRPAPLSGPANPAPRYPWISRQRGEQGRVIVTVAVSAKGHPEEVRIKRSSGHKRLDEAAMAAVRLWRFVPARRASRAVAGHIDVPISFRLTD